MDQVEPLANALAVPTGRYQVELERIEVWRGGIAVLTPARVPQSLVDLHGRLGQVLAREGVSLDERPYRPHVTLARRADIRPDQLARPIVWRSSGYALVLSSGGAYTPIRRYGPESAA